MSPCGKPSACRHACILVEKMWAVRGWKPWGEGITKAWAVRLVAWIIAATGHSRLFLRRGRGIPRYRHIQMWQNTPQEGRCDGQFTVDGIAELPAHALQYTAQVEIIQERLGNPHSKCKIRTMLRFCLTLLYFSDLARKDAYLNR